MNFKVTNLEQAKKILSDIDYLQDSGHGWKNQVVPDWANAIAQEYNELVGNAGLEGSMLIPSIQPLK